VRPVEHGGAALAAAVAGLGAAALYSGLTARPPGGAARWTRTNHRGKTVTLLEGPAVAAAVTAGTLLAPGLPVRNRAAIAAATAGAAAFGCYDDLAGDGAARGFRGHLGALAAGRVTTGVIKIGGIGATGLATAMLFGGSPADRLLTAGLTAGTANLVNLFDLRPGRAIKASLAAGALLAVLPAGRRAAAPVLGCCLAVLPEDLGERAMLGDAGANALGAMLGAAAAAALPRRARAAALLAVGALTAASEVVSFTKVIEAVPALRWLDMLGRRPAEPARLASTR
jgi:UDP-GlcNAc:undecaprenyl-phosphate GlcNAc-1-phosphate transferase